MMHGRIWNEGMWGGECVRSICVVTNISTSFLHRLKKNKERNWIKKHQPLVENIHVRVEKSQKDSCEKGAGKKMWGEKLLRWRTWSCGKKKKEENARP